MWEEEQWGKIKEGVRVKWMGKSYPLSRRKQTQWAAAFYELDGTKTTNLECIKLVSPMMAQNWGHLAAVLAILPRAYFNFFPPPLCDSIF